MAIWIRMDGEWFSVAGTWRLASWKSVMFDHRDGEVIANVDGVEAFIPKAKVQAIHEGDTPPGKELEHDP